jgi:uncharacterized membrane protein YfcA
VDSAHLALVGGAALAGSVVNAIAGGGSLITFPALLACGLPAIAASATNTVAMCPGYLGATWAQRDQLAGQGPRIARVIPAAAIGGALGGMLLVKTGAATFDIVVPFLLLFAVALLGFQEPIRTRLHTLANNELLAVPITGLAAIYGGYFGAGLGVISLAALAIVVADSFVRLNALKQLISLAVNIAAAIVYLSFADLDVVTVLVMACASLVGGFVGGAIASRVSARLLRIVVVSIGLAVAAIYFAKLFRRL